MLSLCSVTGVKDPPAQAPGAHPLLCTVPDMDECSVEVHFSKIIDLMRSFTRITNDVTQLPPART
jgi:hypothetical protein